MAIDLAKSRHALLNSTVPEEPEARLLQHSRGGFLRLYQMKPSWRSYIEGRMRRTAVGMSSLAELAFSGQDSRVCEW